MSSNIMIGTNSLTFGFGVGVVSNLPNPGSTVLFRFGGSSSFIGEISTINFYNPGALIPSRKNNLEIQIYVFFE